VSSTIVFNGYSAVDNLRLDDVHVMGIATFVSSVTVNGQQIDSWTQDSITRVSTRTSYDTVTISA